MSTLKTTLIQVGFHDPENPRQLMTRLRRLFNRVRIDRMEVNILRGFLTAINSLGKPGEPREQKGLNQHYLSVLVSRKRNGRKPAVPD